MPHPLLYGSRICGYAPYTHGLRYDPAEWVILRMTHKRKLTNHLSYSEQWINFHIICYPLYMLIVQVYHDSSCMRDSGRISRLLSHFLTPVALPDSGRCHNFGRISRLWLRITTPVDEHAACLTTSAVKGFTWLAR
jgi:hypothetical protein